MKYRDVAHKLRKMGCRELPQRRTGSHRAWFNAENGRVSTVPDWAAKDLKLGTVRAIVRDLGLDWELFKRS